MRELRSALGHIYYQWDVPRKWQKVNIAVVRPLQIDEFEPPVFEECEILNDGHTSVTGHPVGWHVCDNHPDIIRIDFIL